MKNKMRKWSAWLCGIVAAICFGGAGVALATSAESSNVVASAEDYATFNTVTAIRSEKDSSATALYITDLAGDGGSWNVEGNGGDWDNRYSLEAGSGFGLVLSGRKLTTTDIKQPGAMYIGLGTTAQAGDVFIIDGTYSNATKKKKITFDNCALVFNGTTWEQCEAVYLGSMTPNGGDDKSVSLVGSEAIESGKTLEISSQGVWLNGENANGHVEEIVTTASGITFKADMRDAVADVILLHGALKDKSSNFYYLIDDTYLMWQGTEKGWMKLDGYDAIISKAASVNDGNMPDKASGFYLSLGINTHKEDWDTMLTLVSGQGLKLNGKALSNSAGFLLYHDTLYVQLGTEANVGDILTINGLYQYKNAEKILFAPTQALEWTGSAWVNKDIGGGITYDLDKMLVASASANSATAAANVLYLTREDAGWIPVSDSEVAFAYESGAGVKVNGDNVDYTLKSVNGQVCLEISALNAGDVLSLGGTYTYNQKTRYAIEEGYYEWNGSAWENSEAYFKQEISSGMIEKESATRDGFFFLLDKNVGVINWEQAYEYTDASVKLNGVSIDNVIIKPQGKKLYFDVHALDAKNGDLLTIDGTFICKVGAATSEIVFTQTQAFIYSNGVWTVDEYTTYDVGKMILHVNSSTGGASENNAVLYLQRADEKALPILSWRDPFVLEKGDGFTVNGEQRALNDVKSTGDGFYLSFDGVNAGDEITIGGIFVCETQSARYILEDSSFVWNGNGWEIANYTKHTISNLQPTWPSTSAGSASNSQIYLKINGNVGLPVQTWDHKFVLQRGDGLKVNGTPQTITEMKSAPEGLWLLFGGVEVGATVSLSGVFVCKTLNVQYTIKEINVTWDGSVWMAQSFSDDQLEFADVVTIVDLGWGLSRTMSGVNDLAGSTFTKSEENTTGSIKFRFIYNPTNAAGDSIDIRLHQQNVWGDDVRFIISGGDIRFLHGANVFKFTNGVDYEIELGAITLKDSTSVWMYIKVDGALLGSKLVADAPIGSNKVSFYVGASDNATFKDPDHVGVTYEGSEVQIFEKGSELTLVNATNDKFVGWVVNGALYAAGDTLILDEGDLTIRAFEMNFKLKYGAAIRLTDTVEESGIRFTTMMNTADFNALNSYDVRVNFGTLIMPNDYLAAGQAPNLVDFVAGSTILKIQNSGYTETDRDDANYTAYYGAMNKLFAKNYGREFAGRGYMEITFESGAVRTIYTAFSADNVRSVKWIANALMNDANGTGEYNALSDAKKAVVQGYANSADYSKSVKMARKATAQMEENYAAVFVASSKKESV